MCNQALPSKVGSISSTWEHLEFILRKQATWICLPSTLQVFYGFETCWNFLSYSLLLHIVLATRCIDACLYIGKLTYMSKIRLNAYTHKLSCWLEWEYSWWFLDKVCLLSASQWPNLSIYCFQKCDSNWVHWFLYDWFALNLSRIMCTNLHPLLGADEFTRE